MLAIRVAAAQLATHAYCTATGDTSHHRSMMPIPDQHCSHQHVHLWAGCASLAWNHSRWSQCCPNRLCPALIYASMDSTNICIVATMHILVHHAIARAGRARIMQLWLKGSCLGNILLGRRSLCVLAVSVENVCCDNELQVSCSQQSSRAVCIHPTNAQCTQCVLYKSV